MPAATTSPDGTTGQAPASPAPQDGNVEVPQDGEHEGSSSITDVAVLQRELSKAQRQAAESRIELKAIRDAEQTKADAELDETTRLTKRQKELELEVEKLTKQARRAVLEAAIVKQAITLGIHDPDAAVKLLDTDELELDDEGEPKNVESALKALIKAKPYLATKPEAGTPGSLNGGAGGDAGPAPRLSADELAQAQTAGMTPERYAALKGVKTLDDWKKTQAGAK